MPMCPLRAVPAIRAFMLLAIVVISRPVTAADTPAETAEAIAAACSEKRYSDVSSYLHSSLRRIWIEIDYKIKDFCTLLTRNYTLRSWRIDSEQRSNQHAIIFLTYVFDDGTKRGDREVFIEERGAWRLAN